MTAFALAYTFHVLAALVWVGGMFFAWMILRPAAAETLEPPARLRLWLSVFKRFFVWVWGAVAVLPLTGIGMLHMSYAGFDAAPRYVHIMMGLYLVMLALFLRIQALQLPELRRAVESENWPAGGEMLGRIRRLVGSNLLIGLALMTLAAMRPTF